MGIGGRIREAVEQLGLTLKQAADKTGLPYSSLQNWAGGHREPRPEALITIGSRLGISIDWLLTGHGAMARGDAHTPLNSSEDPREQALLALWRGLDEHAQQDIQRAVEEKKRLATMESRLADLEAVVADIKRLA